LPAKGKNLLIRLAAFEGQYFSANRPWNGGLVVFNFKKGKEIFAYFDIWVKIRKKLFLAFENGQFFVCELLLENKSPIISGKSSSWPIKIRDIPSYCSRYARINIMRISYDFTRDQIFILFCS